MSEPIGITTSELITRQKEFVVYMADSIKTIKMDIRSLILQFNPDITPIVLEALEEVILKEIMDYSAIEWNKFNGFKV